MAKQQIVIHTCAVRVYSMHAASWNPPRHQHLWCFLLMKAIILKSELLVDTSFIFLFANCGRISLNGYVVIATKWQVPWNFSIMKFLKHQGAFTWAPWCESNAYPIRIGCVHMNAHWLDAHPMQIWCESDWIHLLRWFGCAFKEDCIIIHDSRKVTTTARSLALLALLIGLTYGACLWVLFVLLLQQCWGRNRFVCWWSTRVVQQGKIKSTMVPLSTVLKFDVL